jgi:hypothetical protein
MNTRMQKFGLKTLIYEGWPVFYFVGNPYLPTEYAFYNNFIILRCEDSYIHVAKKVVMGIAVIYSLFNVTEGILRCGDDLIFNENALTKFLQGPKTDYMGYCPIYNKYGPTEIFINVIDNFMPNYYEKHRDELSNPLHGINKTIEEIRKYNKIPKFRYAGGVVVYLSKKSCILLIEHFKLINWDIYKYENNIGYPYIIEDVAVGFILLLYNIQLTNIMFYANKQILANESTIAIHTNEYK